MLEKLIPVALLAASFLSMSTGCSIEKKGSNNNDDVRLETPIGSMKIKTNEAVIAADTGLPSYPGATVVTKGKDANAADIDMNFGDFRLRVKAVTYRTGDTSEKVLGFYRKELARYGDVIECKGNRTVGPHSKTSEGLTCDNDNPKAFRYKNDTLDRADVELKAGSKTRQHIVTVEALQDGTKFGLVALDLPKGEGQEKQSN